MGDFIAVTAFKVQSVEEVMNCVVDYATLYNVTAEQIPLNEPLDHRNNAHFYQPPGEWTIVWWPYYFNIHDFPLVRTIAANEGWLISTVHVYDGDYWEHLCCFGEIELHAFNSWPNYWKEDGGEDYDRILGYDSSPDRLAEALGIEPSVIQPYLVDVEAFHDYEEKAYEDDEFPLASYWVFVDFWRRLGIPYPEETDVKSAVQFAGDLMKKLPAA
jgi:hypothetical protein